ncbi:MAG: hypothetical protein HRU36_03445 [Rickettsiales bacterium]|nr:hypothetical protein [Rickettsiales bacterium]
MTDKIHGISGVDYDKSTEIFYSVSDRAGEKIITFNLNSENELSNINRGSPGIRDMEEIKISSDYIYISDEGDGLYRISRDDNNKKKIINYEDFGLKGSNFVIEAFDFYQNDQHTVFMLFEEGKEKQSQRRIFLEQCNDDFSCELSGTISRDASKVEEVGRYFYQPTAFNILTVEDDTVCGLLLERVCSKYMSSSYKGGDFYNQISYLCINIKDNSTTEDYIVHEFGKSQMNLEAMYVDENRVLLFSDDNSQLSGSLGKTHIVELDFVP